MLPRPEIVELEEVLEDYKEILSNHAQAKIVSLTERRRILKEYQYFLDLYNRLQSRGARTW